MNAEYNGTPISLYVAEVLAIPSKETYTLREQRESADNIHHVYEITCKIITPDPYSPTLYNIKPADNNTKRIPIVGEQVLIFKGYGEDSNIERLSPQWYYLTTLSVSSNTNNNALPGLSKYNNTATGSADTFTERSIPALQLYEGDSAIEGRWGNSIRFGSTIDTTRARVDVNPNYSGNVGSPIIILSNGKQSGSEFVVENFDTDASCLYLTSDQKLNTLTTSNPVASENSVSNFNKSQLVGVADRIVLKSKTDSVIVDAKRSIEINAPTVYIGSSDKTDKEPLLHSTAVVSLLQKIVSVLKIGFADSSGAICTELYSIPEADYAKLFAELTNDNILVDKYKKTNINI